MKQKTGFTIIELLVAVVLSGLLLSMAIVSYRGVGEKQAVKQAGITFKTNLKSYQQKALASEKPTGCDSDDQLLGYTVSYVDSNSYSVQASCPGGNPSAVTVDLPGEIEFDASFSPNSIFFPVLDSTVTGSQTIDITNQDNDYTYRVVVESSGVIRGEML